MTKLRLGLLAFVLLAVVSGVFAQGSKARHRSMKTHAAQVAITPDEIKWGPAPPSLPPGAQLGVLQGDPSKPGAPFHIRSVFPDGYTVPPHWHPTDENVMVLEGAMLMGQGDKFDESAARELPAGSFATMPKGM